MAVVLKKSWLHNNMRVIEVSEVRKIIDREIKAESTKCQACNGSPAKEYSVDKATFILCDKCIILIKAVVEQNKRNEMEDDIEIHCKDCGITIYTGRPDGSVGVCIDYDDPCPKNNGGKHREEKPIPSSRD